MTEELTAIEMNKVEAKLAHAEQSRSNVLLTTRELRALVDKANGRNAEAERLRAEVDKLRRDVWGWSQDYNDLDRKLAELRASLAPSPVKGGTK